MACITFVLHNHATPMIDWKRGGWTGSINVYVRREVDQHMRENAAVKSARYSWKLQLLRCALANRSFTSFVTMYFILCMVVILFDLALSWLAPEVMLRLTRVLPTTSQTETLLNTFAGYAIAAQTGVLGVISIAVGLVPLIAERQGAGTDVKVYYYASLAFEVVASCIALLLVLCVQLVWPIHVAISRLNDGMVTQMSKLTLLGFHLAWLALNLSAMAHFVATTLRFVQQTARQELRELYTANAVLPFEMTKRMRQALYLAAGAEMSQRPRRNDGENSEQLEVHFGMDFGQPEMYRTFSGSAALNDVYVPLVKWAALRWHKRCKRLGIISSKGGLGPEGPTLFFPLHLDYVVRGTIPFCSRRGGVPLDRVEQFMLAFAFRFRAAHEET